MLEYYTLHNIVQLCKSNKTIWMFFRKFADEEDNLVNNPDIYNVEGNTKLLSSLHQVATPDNRKCVEIQGFFQ